MPDTWKLCKHPKVDWTCDSCDRHFGTDAPHWFRWHETTIEGYGAAFVIRLCCPCYKADGGIIHDDFTAAKQRLAACLHFCRGIPTEKLRGRTLNAVLLGNLAGLLEHLGVKSRVHLRHGKQKTGSRRERGVALG